MRDHLVVGIAGGSGSGKTTFYNRLTESVGADAVVTLHHDCYYHDLSHQSQEERYANNYDAPEALQTDLLVEHVHQLISGDSVVMPQYDYSTNSRLPGGFPLDPRPIIIIEGVLVLADETPEPKVPECFASLVCIYQLLLIRTETNYIFTFPYLQLLDSPALHNFSPDPNDDQQISLSAGDELNDVMSIGNGWSEGVNVGTGQKGVSGQ